MQILRQYVLCPIGCLSRCDQGEALTRIRAEQGAQILLVSHVPFLNLIICCVGVAYLYSRFTDQAALACAAHSADYSIFCGYPVAEPGILFSALQRVR